MEMKDARTPEKPNSAPKTGDQSPNAIVLLIICGLSATALLTLVLRKRKHRKASEKK